MKYFKNFGKFHVKRMKLHLNRMKFDILLKEFPYKDLHQFLVWIKVTSLFQGYSFCMLYEVQMQKNMHNFIKILILHKK